MRHSNQLGCRWRRSKTPSHQVWFGQPSPSSLNRKHRRGCSCAISIARSNGDLLNGLPAVLPTAALIVKSVRIRFATLVAVGKLMRGMNTPGETSTSSAGGSHFKHIDADRCHRQLQLYQWLPRALVLCTGCQHRRPTAEGTSITACACAREPANSRAEMHLPRSRSNDVQT